MIILHKILTTPSDDIIVELVNQSNNSQLIGKHVSVDTSINSSATQQATLTAVTETDTGETGIYKGSVEVTYDRPTMDLLLPTIPSFVVTLAYPFTFGELRTLLLTEYGLLLEEKDIAERKDSVNHVTDNFIYNEAYYHIVDNKIKLYVHGASPRFAPMGTPSFSIEVVEENGGQLDLLAPTTDLNPLHTYGG